MPEKRKVGGSTPPLTTGTPFDLRNDDSVNGRWAPLIRATTGNHECGGAAPPVGGAAGRRAFPRVIGSLRFDLTVVRKPPACRADERPLMRASVGRVSAAPVW